MKSYKVTGMDPANPDKFLAYMVPSPNEVDVLVSSSKFKASQHLRFISFCHGSYVVYRL